jgi:DNA-binding XRE family transcriptional regulator
MVDTSSFKDRLECILAHYELNAAAFADAIGVQRSSISHLLNGRNKPSLDFVLKVVRKYPEVNLYWLLNGKGGFPDPASGGKPTTEPTQEPTPQPLHSFGFPQQEGEIESVIILYKDGSFRKFTPSKVK